MRISDFFCGPVLCVFWLPAGTDPARLSAPEEVTAALGGSLTVSCRYAHTYRDHTKYWCKGKTYELCHIVVKTPRNRPSSRAFIEDYKQKGFFTVTMTSLEERDEDQYWCVISTSWRNVHTGVRVRISHPSGEIPTHSESCVGEAVYQDVIWDCPPPTVTTRSTSTLTPSAPVTQCWWAVLRWILFILLLCCLISTHIFEWRITPSKNSTK
ncbi:CMRF35-like molecule 3 isoform X2 [Takifugu rubripes]|uniref:CMRF35-like molecule 3 isoform X2 n=1 Tax=Takifugu rubripes TaxID=31033 RepID=UPI0011456334|nr:CMRF35-like molecule 3 isoform X2 [Takifugu rubripes]